MEYERKKYWKVRFFPTSGEGKSPEDVVKEIDRDDESAAIYRRLQTIEEIQYPREWPQTKVYGLEEFTIYQVTVGRHRLFIYLDTEQNRNYAVVCHVCPKKSQEAKKKDKDRTVRNIRNYLSK